MFTNYIMIQFNEIMYFRQRNPQMLCNVMLRNIFPKVLPYLPAQSLTEW